MRRRSFAYTTLLTVGMVFCGTIPARADAPAASTPMAQATPSPQAMPAGVVVKAKPVTSSVPQVTQGVGQQQVPQVITQPPAPQFPASASAQPKKRREDPVSFFFGFLKHLFGKNDDDRPDVY